MSIPEWAIEYYLEWYQLIESNEYTRVDNSNIESHLSIILQQNKVNQQEITTPREYMIRLRQQYPSN